MNLQQLQFVREVVNQNYKLTLAANVLHVSQPAVSYAISELEAELGITFFNRAGKRLQGLTPEGAEALNIIDRILNEVRNLSSVGEDYHEESQGNLVIATTHTQARYVLPRVVKDFMKTYPRVNLSILELNPQQIVTELQQGRADIGLASESIYKAEGVIALPCYQWQHTLIVPPTHSLAQLEEPLTLADLARYPIITYEPAFAGRKKIDAAFAAAALQPNVVLQAMDADVIKTYVDLGLGIGIIAEMAFDEVRDGVHNDLVQQGYQGLVSHSIGYLFGDQTAFIGIKKQRQLRKFGLGFLALLTPRLSHQHLLDAGVSV